MLRTLTQQLIAQGATGDLRRLRELRDLDTDHQWVSLIDPTEGARLTDAQWRTCVKHRLGATFLGEVGT
eukprot:5122440-Lingulodinium_polyedra.AAC.1